MHFVRLAEGEVDGVVAAGGLELTPGCATEGKVNRFDVGDRNLISQKDFVLEENPPLAAGADTVRGVPVVEVLRALAVYIEFGEFAVEAVFVPVCDQKLEGLVLTFSNDLF